MTRIDALTEIIKEARIESRSKSQLFRLRLACDKLRFTEDEKRHVEGLLEYRDSNGRLYAPFEMQW